MPTGRDCSTQWIKMFMFFFFNPHLWLHTFAVISTTFQSFFKYMLQLKISGLQVCLQDKNQRVKCVAVCVCIKSWLRCGQVLFRWWQTDWNMQNLFYSYFACSLTMIKILLLSSMFFIHSFNSVSVFTGISSLHVICLLYTTFLFCTHTDTLLSDLMFCAGSDSKIMIVQYFNLKTFDLILHLPTDSDISQKC